MWVLPPASQLTIRNLPGPLIELARRSGRSGHQGLDRGQGSGDVILKASI
jgi:hypothetical protein